METKHVPSLFADLIEQMMPFYPHWEVNATNRWYLCRFVKHVSAQDHLFIKGTPQGLVLGPGENCAVLCYAVLCFAAASLGFE